jgi:hypothetical protein
MKADLVLLYYDKPQILRNWFTRLFNHSDFLKYSKFFNIIIADSGTPRENVNNTISVLDEFKHIKNCIYARAETEEIRKRVPEGIDARPACHAFNMATLDVSKADLIFLSVIGHIFTPKYFERIIAIHLQNEKAIVLPRRFDLECNIYHDQLANSPYTELKKFAFLPSGGWPDMSLRRKWIEEVGGWDENYITIAPVDMDIGSRLTGKLDNGLPSEALFTYKGKFDNLGLDFIQPYIEDEVLSLTCNTYSGHTPTGDSRRQKGYDMGIKYYLDHWGEIKRNQNRIPVQHEIVEY